jgi:CheY-like chemotaxis protein/CHASE3 domain sensor protein/putative methionine-R-sulfoxide reductase with GAF domain
MKMTLNQKILSGFIVCTIILVATAFFAIRSSNKFVDTTNWVNHTHEVLAEFDQLLSATVDEETGVRGFVITGNDAFLEPYNVARNSIREHLDKVRNMTIDNPVQEKNIDALQIQIKLSEDHLQELIKLRKKDFDKARELIATGKGKQLQDETRRIIANCKALENKLLVIRKQANEDDSNNFNIVFITLLIVIAIVLISVFIVINTNLMALNKAERESADRNWILTGNFELNEKIRGEKTETELAQSIINQLCTYLNTQIGAIYLFDNGQLNLAGSYAYNFRKQNTSIIKPGEGLVGQAAAEKKIIVFTEVPDDYIRINSGLGNTIPKNLIMLPLLQDDALKGVIEIGSVKEFSPLQMEFLNKIGENIAIVINATQSRRKLKELLEETQRQAEELEVQQEELKQSNEELLQKTELLEKSESSLKTQQEELQQTNEELEEKANLLEEQKEKLENAKLDIETKARELVVTSKYKSEFLANMSHELRTPLNSILILAQLLSENKSRSLAEKEVEFARNVYSSGIDLLNLINEILDLSKVESGKMELDIAEVPFTEITSDITAMFSEVAKNKSINLTFKLNEKELEDTIETDKQRLEQILRNLLSNAFKFTSKGGNVLLAIDKINKADVIFKNKKLYQTAEIISMSVTDTGIGIPGDKLGIVFEAFQQADGSTKRKYGGTGLGLSISRELANALGGEIHLQSEEGKGSTFTLYLPLKFDSSVIDPEERSVAVRGENEGIAKKNKTAEMLIYTDGDAIDDRYNIQGNEKIVLIMEDDHDYAQVLLSFVRERQYKGIIAHEGNTGLSYARFYKPDAIFLDMKLPVMDGADVLKQLKTDPDLRHIPVMIISGYDRKKEGLELGAFDFMQKPISINDLQRAFIKIENFISKILKKLLIVEDNEGQNNAISELIGNGDVKCFSAYSGNQAYEMMRKESFDCVIVDLGLPDMTGFDLMKKIKDNGDLRKTPIIVYTAKDLTKDESSRLNKLANTVVLKTVDSHERLLDETTLFLHRVESRLPKEKQNIIRKLHKTDEVLKNKKVLIVDDDIRNIYSLTNVLEEEGLNCLTAENGKAALQILAEYPEIDIVLMDVMMPEMDGYDATKEIRNISKFIKLPIIGLTAKAMKGDREKCLNAGMSDYITKPVNIEQLLSLMRVWLYR